MSSVETPMNEAVDPDLIAGQRRILEHLPSQQRTTNEQALARSKLVRRLRIALPVLAVVLIGAFFLNTRSNQVDEAFLEDFVNLEVTPDELEMANPRFAGIDEKGQPFEITAEAATRTPDADEVVSLNRPRAVTQGSHEQTVVFANSGLYRSNEKILELEDEVTLEHVIGSDNYVLRTPAATVLIDEDRVESDRGVEGEGPGGNTLSADKMKAYENEGRIVFEGNVKLKIHRNAKVDDETDTTAVKLRNADAAKISSRRSPE